MLIIQGEVVVDVLPARHKVVQREMAFASQKSGSPWLITWKVMNMGFIMNGLSCSPKTRIHEFSRECRLKKPNAEPVALAMKLMTELMCGGYPRTH